jgi:glycosyltransferase involved in cell wall biosynthesis
MGLRRLTRIGAALTGGRSGAQSLGGSAEAALVPAPAGHPSAACDPLPPSPAPRISVIVPLYNAQRSSETYLRQALDSVAGQLYREFELILVDDGSTDDTAAVAAAFVAAHPELEITTLHQANAGQSSARNLGASHAKGDWLAFLDQDDIWRPGRLWIVVPYLTEDVDLVYTDADTIDAQGRIALRALHRDHGAGGVHPKLRLEDAIYRDAFVMPGVTTVRRSLFEQLGGFDERLSGYEDDDFFVRAVQAGRVGYVPVSTLLWRMYDASYSQSQRMVTSRLIYWRKLLDEYGTDAGSSRRITLRFAKEFLAQCSGQLDTGHPLARENLAAAVELVAFLGAVDRAAFRVSRWAWTSRSRAAFYARWWLLNGLQAGS